MADSKQPAVAAPPAAAADSKADQKSLPPAAAASAGGAAAAAAGASAAGAGASGEGKSSAAAAGAAAGAGANVIDGVDLDTVDPHELMRLIKSLPPTSKGMSAAEKATHTAKVDALLAAFERRQEAARLQLYEMQQQKRKFLAYLKEHYKPLHPHLYQLKGWRFAESFAKAVASKDAKQQTAVMTEASPAGASSRVFVFDMLSAQTCAELCAEVRHFEQWMSANKQSIQRPNTMNKYGVILDDIGFAPCLRELMNTYIAPLARVLYADVGGGALDGHHGFVVEYAMAGDRKLDLHVDDAEVTLNLSLGETFEGGGLEFAGARCAYHQGTEPDKAEVFRCEHQTGHAYLHRGRHRHMATPITAGHRMNLIVWCVSMNYREAEQEQATCARWCGFHEQGKAMRAERGQPPLPTDHAQPFLFGHGGPAAPPKTEYGHGGAVQHTHGHDDDDDDDDDDGCHGHSHGHGHDHGHSHAGGHACDHADADDDHHHHHHHHHGGGAHGHSHDHAHAHAHAGPHALAGAANVPDAPAAAAAAKPAAANGNGAAAPAAGK